MGFVEQLVRRRSVEARVIKSVNREIDRHDGVVVRASASQSVDLEFIPLVESKDFNKWHPQLPCLAVSF